jgi:hypothetical protein
MRAKDFLNEAFGSEFSLHTTKLPPQSANPLPATYAIPKLQNNDPYHQYRFGVAIAAAKGRHYDKQQGTNRLEPSTPWGENEVIVSFDPHIEEWIDDALVQIGLKPSDKRLISTMKSKEMPGIDKTSPIQGFKGYER